MEKTNTTELQNSPSTAVSVISGLLGVLTFAGVFGATFYFGFQAIIPLFAGGAVGLVAGLFAAAVAKKRGRTALAKASMLLCLAAGVIGGILLAGPVAVVTIAIAQLRPALGSNSEQAGMAGE